MACVCNPIFINTFVVFVRLYWFEKRFQNVVQEARNMRRTRSRSIARSMTQEERDFGREEMGVGGREIQVVRHQDGHAKGNRINPEGVAEHEDEKEDQSNDIEGDSPESSEPTQQPFTRDITFADDVRPPPRKITNLDRLPEQRSAEHHIAFVENQRRPKTTGRLRIPGPRDFDRGDVPHRLEEDDYGNDMNKQVTRESESRGRKDSEEANQPADAVDPASINGDDHPFKSHATADDSSPHRGRLLKTGLSGLRSRFRRGNGDENGFWQRNRTGTFKSFVTSRSQDRDPMPYLSWTPTVGRNSAFVDLTEEQREELGGIEYRALKTLAFVLVLYFVGFHLLGLVVMLPWMVREQYYKKNVLEPDGINAAWWGVFTPASMFNDLGYTLTPDSMSSFQDAVLPLLLGTYLIIIGNTGFPCMLRLVIWLAERIVPYGSGVWEELRFLLDHPRRCFTLLFPSQATWWLFWVLVLLNGIDLIFFVILDLHDSTVTSLGPGFRVLDGLFQAASTRTAGFAVVNLANLHPAVQVSYLIMMYISVFPIAISMRRTNVYEEKSLGIWAGDDGGTSSDDPNTATDQSQEQSYVGTHLRRQLSFDLWYVFLGFFLIAIIEGSRLENTNDYQFTLFSVLFEIVSAYGTVGLSLGYPGINASFSAEFRTLSKLIIIAMQIRGRHRGLPYALDRAILLPSETLHKKEDEDALRRAQRRGSNLSDMDGATSGAQVGTPGPGGRTGTVARRASTFSENGGAGGGHGRRESMAGLTKFLSGALSAGPTVMREKRA
ncbi:hypothetical protein K490DRAFT_33318 [Saccharata proteae CBS 121410]|uniref:Potassium transport protein n=1 Tax=Saccharata proteae CBS 121410 TaxID=1314787 RepID=A0A9P4I083_9PEZI|nr:hypothetical protein K490DRAFT_33318 [Saccharata proteae CBS 121410]